eukprot:CFRG7934T1
MAHDGVVSEGTKNTVAYLGVPGTYTHLACKENLTDWEYVPKPSFHACMEAVEKGEVHSALVPIENSTAGRVSEVHHLLRNSTLFITAEYFHSINHYLLATQNANIDDVEQVLSHEQALSQCKDFIRSQGFTPVPFSGTAVAAEHVSKLNDKSKGVIASELCAELYNLRIVKKCVQDVKGNTTRFILLQRSKKTPVMRKQEQYITSLYIHSKDDGHDFDLCKVLQCLIDHNLYVIKMETYSKCLQVRGLYVEVKCHERALEDAHQHINNSQSEVRQGCRFVKMKIYHSFLY